jgi:pimeloyl-ACP methyl ester carboxylesterase
LNQLTVLCTGRAELNLIGSSFGGLMATCYAIGNRKSVRQLTLLAPALNFAEYTPPPRMLNIPTLLVIGRYDTVTPPDLVLPMAEKTFSDLEVMVVDDDHMLHNTFRTLPWRERFME